VILGVILFAAGLWLLVESAERLVRVVSGYAAAAGLSGVVVSALVLGLDVESLGAGVAATLRDLPGTALGATLGGATFLLTMGLGLAAVVAPFTVAVPRRVLLAGAGASALPVLLMADGQLSRLDGALLVAAWPAGLYLLYTSRRVLTIQQTAGLLSSAAERGSRPAVWIAVGLAGLVVGAEALVLGTERIVEDLGVSETAFGLLAVGAAVSFEEVVLELLPAWRGMPDVTVGNAVGTLIFLVTVALGATALARPVAVPTAVLAIHVPAFGAAATAALLLLARGRLGRAEGVVLIAGYAAYATVGAVSGG
jgi:cation:H+ antiporter